MTENKENRTNNKNWKRQKENKEEMLKRIKVNNRAMLDHSFEKMFLCIFVQKRLTNGSGPLVFWIFDFLIRIKFWPNPTGSNGPLALFFHPLTLPENPSYCRHFFQSLKNWHKQERDPIFQLFNALIIWPNLTSYNWFFPPLISLWGHDIFLKNWFLKGMTYTRNKNAWKKRKDKRKEKHTFSKESKSTCQSIQK